MRRSRFDRLRAALALNSLDALVVTSRANIRYLTGFTGTNGLVLVTRRRQWLVTDVRYALQSRLEARACRRIVTPGVLVDAVAEAGCLTGCRRVGFESAHVTYASYRRLRSVFPRCSFRPVQDLVEDLAVRKSREELAALERACAITDSVFATILERIQPGVRESDIAAEITLLHRRAGAEGDAFAPQVASGERAALPHGGATSRRIRSGDMVVLDFGCVVDGYHSDLSRTVAVGRASRKLRELHAMVDSARQAALDAARPGVAARELDAVARNVITGGHLGAQFTHALGHGLGLRIHERPRLSSRSSDILAKDMVCTLEPGVYLPGYGGVRIEDDIVVTARGARTLTRATRELLIL